MAQKLSEMIEDEFGYQIIRLLAPMNARNQRVISLTTFCNWRPKN